VSSSSPCMGLLWVARLLMRTHYFIQGSCLLSRFLFFFFFCASCVSISLHLCRLLLSQDASDEAVCSGLESAVAL
jgi:hypothetical protein